MIFSLTVLDEIHYKKLKMSRKHAYNKEDFLLINVIMVRDFLAKIYK